MVKMDKEKKKMVNKAGQAIELSYEDDRLKEIVEPISGERMHFDYDEKHRLNAVYDDHNREASLAYNKAGLLERVTAVLGNVTSYTYNDKRLLTEAVNAEGNTFVKLQYNNKGKVVAQTFPEGYTETYEYETVTEGQANYITLIITDDTGNKTYRTVDEDGQLVKEVDAMGYEFYYQYNNDHQKVASVDGNGNTTRYEYNTYGDVTKITDAMNYVTTFTYDDHRNLLSSTDAKGRVTTYNYENNLMKTQTLPSGAVYSYEYTNDGLLERETKQDYHEGRDGVTTYQYDKGRVTAIIDENGYRTSMTYDQYGYPQSTTDREGKTTKYQYDALGQLRSQVNAKGYKVSYEYNKIGLVTEMSDEKGKTSYMYDMEGKKKQEIDPRGNVTTYDYTLKGLPKLIIYANGSNEQMTYYANNQVATSIDRNNATTTYTYDGAGNVVTVKSPQTGTTTYTYDGLNRKVTETNDKGNTTTYKYDAVGNIEKIIAPDRFVTTQVYDEMNHLVKLTNGCLETCEYAYDKWGRKESETDGNGHQTTYRYDLAGNVCEVTNVLGEKTSFTYDKENRLLTTTNPMGYVSSQTYDAVGNVETTTDAEGRTTKTLYTNHGDVKYQYDGEGRLVASMTYDAAYNLETVTDALGHTTTNTYTNMNQLKTSINPLGQKKIRGYDNRGNLNEVVDPPTLDRKESVVTKALYNAKGQVRTITDPEGNVQSYDYDTLGNLKYEHTAFGGTNSYTYNALNLLETSKNARGQSAVYTYDVAGRVETMKDEVDETTYKYDKNGNLLKVISKNNSTITRTFDALNRVKTYTDTRGNTISYDYDQAGNLSKMTYPNAQVVTYQYDHAGLLTDVIDFNGGVTHYEYDNNGRVRMMTRPNGTSKETTYDVLGQVKAVVEKNSQGEIITQFGYDYDAAGNMVKETGLNDNPEIPSSETVMTYGKGNRLATYNGETVTYDANGNMNPGPLNGKMVDFVYDARNRLMKAGDITYLYDAENNRIGMIEAGVKTTYTINPHANLTEVLQSKKGNKVTQYIYGTGLIMQVTGGEYATYHYDFRGSTVAITDGKGKVTDTFIYSPYGKLLGRTGTTDTPFLYNGMYGVETDDNGLYCMRSRYYNPTIMHFINQDVVQGSLDNAITLNRYAYANGNPITYIDPFGLAALYDTYHMDENAKTALIRDNRAADIIKIENDFKARQLQVYKRDCAIESANQEMARLYKKGKWLDFADGAISFVDQFYHACPFVNVIYVSAKGDIGALTDPYFDQAKWEREWCDTMNGHITMAVLEGILLKLGMPLVNYGSSKLVKITNTSISKGAGNASCGDAKFMNPKDGFLKNISKRADIDANGCYDVIAHGTPNGIQITHNGKTMIVDSRIAARLIQNSEGYSGQPIRLLSCNTGALENGFAQNLANKLNVPVYAPTNYLWAYPNGNYLVAGMTNAMAPDLNNIGTFKLFIPGGNQ